jgi:hypothetical protein
MSEYLLATRFRFIADALLAGRKLNVTADTRDALAKAIMYGRMPARSKALLLSPIPAVKKAEGHAIALLKYRESPPTDEQSIPLRYSKMLRALDLRAVITLYFATPSFDASTFPKSLTASRLRQRAPVERLHRLLSAITSVKQRSWKFGRPTRHEQLLVVVGCDVWKNAGKTSPCYRWDQGANKVRGTLASFIREIHSCYAGTHALMRPTPGAFRAPVARCRGDRTRLPEETLHDWLKKTRNLPRFREAWPTKKMLDISP